jgi:hypothetical protein
MTARLPDELVMTNQIRKMRVGDSGWAVPWAMAVDRHKRCTLRADYTIEPQPGGTLQMFIERRSDGYHVTVPTGYVYEPERDDMAELSIQSITVGDRSYGGRSNARIITIDPPSLLLASGEPIKVEDVPQPKRRWFRFRGHR